MTRPARSASFSYVGERLTTTYYSVCNRMSLRRHKQRMNNLEASIHVLQSQLADLLSSNTAMKASIATLTAQVHSLHNDSPHKHKRACVQSPRARQLTTLPTPQGQKPHQTEERPCVGSENTAEPSDSAETAEWFTLTSGSVRSI